ncbi:MAG: M1 family aminopeptidase [Candidatus Zixiibacteriota bacterium]
MSASFVTLLVISLVLFSPCSGLGAQDITTVNPDGLTASELHRILGEAKAQALDRSRRMQQAAASLPQVPQTNYDVKWYDVSIRVNDTTEILYGNVTLVAAAAADGVTQIDVDLHTAMAVNSITGSSGPLAFSRSGDYVTVTLDQSYDTGEQFQFDIAYSGHPVEGGLQAFAFDFRNGYRVISSLSEPYFSRTWWPCKDRNDDKPDSMGIHIESDTALYCASNGTLDSITTVPGSNSRTFHYTVRYPIVTYLFSVAIAPYTVWQQPYIFTNTGDELDTMPVIHHVYPDYYALSLTTWNQTPTMIATLADDFGPYPFPNEKYGHANFEWGGAMEHQTCTSMGGGTFGFGWGVTVHELGHQWWGDLVTCESWHDIWLNEGWASYSEAVYQLGISGWAAYHSHMNTMAYKGSGTVWCDDTANVYRIFNGNLSYDKGAWVVHMLRGVLGEELFATGVEAYYNVFAYSSATSYEFQQCWEIATGVDLDAFMLQWLYGQYCPNYSFYYMDEPSDSGGYDIYLVVKQTQTTYPQVFEMPVDFFFDYSGQPDDTITLTIDERSEFFKFNEPADLTQIKLDPAGWVLKNVSNPAWQMFIITLDAELSDGLVDIAYLDTIETRGGTGSNVVSIGSGILPPGLTISNEGVISGTPTTEGVYSFQVGFVNPATGYSDQRRFDIAITTPPCCSGQVGDVNGEGGDEPTIGDITMLIDLLFITGSVPDCLTEADVNQSGGPEPTVGDISIGDVTILIDHVFISGVELPNCL